MKFQLIIEGDSPAELYALVDRMRGAASNVVVQIPAEANGEKPIIVGGDAPAAPRKRKTTAAPAVASPAEAQPSAAPAAATPSPAPAVSSPPASPSASPEPTAAVDPSKLTEADTRKALKSVNDVQGLGMEACRAMLLSFNVEQISKLPKDKYADFIAACAKRIEDHKAAK